MVRYTVLIAEDAERPSYSLLQFTSTMLSDLWLRLSIFVTDRSRAAFLRGAGIVVFVLLVLLTIIAIPHSASNVKTASPSEYAVIPSNFADPCLLSVDGMFYAFATRPNPSLHVQVASAKDISDWTLHEGYDAMPTLPKWALQEGDAAVWAPEVVQRPDGNFVLYFSAASQANSRFHCVGTATSPNVTGPYTPVEEPLTCPFDQGGAIDPTFIHDRRQNTSFVVYKNDGNAIGSGGACANGNWPNTPTSFQFNIVDNEDYTTRIGNDSWNPLGNASWVLFSDESDGPNIESPQIFYRGDAMGRFAAAGDDSAYHLIYNAGCFADESYRIEHIVCRATQLNAVSTQWASYDATYVPFFRDCRFAAMKPENYKSWGQSFLVLNDGVGNHFDLLLRTGIFRQPDGAGVQLYAPGGPAISQDGSYMAFHADISRDWFEGRSPDRIRALFVAELEYGRKGTGLRIKRLIKPTSKI
ncbi:glycosyl hydrolase [Exophiala viscosa]|uniref:Glycosyl hydrolase n=1 Tax=Exophiala viscosa TaxID=2486360 RepID=A0AAN6IEI4_9EURO|nr:glycosyl hydrolase [Exophiala viscosa]